MTLKVSSEVVKMFEDAEKIGHILIEQALAESTVEPRAEEDAWLINEPLADLPLRTHIQRLRLVHMAEDSTLHDGWSEWEQIYDFPRALTVDEMAQLSDLGSDLPPPNAVSKDHDMLRLSGGPKIRWGSDPNYGSDLLPDTSVRVSCLRPRGCLALAWLLPALLVGTVVFMGSKLARAWRWLVGYANG